MPETKNNMTKNKPTPPECTSEATLSCEDTLSKVEDTLGITINLEAFAAFRKSMEGRRYGEPEAIEAWHWFKAGYESHQASHSKLEHDLEEAYDQLEFWRTRGESDAE